MLIGVVDSFGVDGGAINVIDRVVVGVDVVVDVVGCVFWWCSCCRC